MKIKLKKIVGNLLDKFRKLYEWNGHLESVSRPQVIEDSRQYLLLRTDNPQKTVDRCSWFLHDGIEKFVIKLDQNRHFILASV